MSLRIAATTAALVLATKLAQKMNGERVELVSDIFRICDYFFWHCDVIP